MMLLVFMTLFLPVITTSFSKNRQCCNLKCDKYQIKIDLNPGAIYQVYMFHPDGRVVVGSNTENGITAGSAINFQPYTTPLGDWKCVGKNQIHIRTTGYNFQVSSSSTASTLYLADILMNFTANCENVSGTFKLWFFPLGSFLTDANKQPSPDLSFRPIPITGRQLCLFEIRV